MPVVAHDRSHQRLPAQPVLRLRQRGVHRGQVAMQQGQLDGRDGAARDRAQPGRVDRQRGHKVGVAGAQQGTVRQRLHKRVAREFRMPLPLDGVARHPQSHEITGQCVHRQSLLAGQAAQVLPLNLARDALVEHRHIHNQRRQSHPRRRPGVHLVVQHGTQGVVHGKQAGRARSARIFDRGAHRRHCAVSGRDYRTNSRYSRPRIRLSLSTL